MSALSGLLHPEVERHLLASENEFIVDQVERHWITRLPGAGLVILGCLTLLGMPLMRAGWPLGLLAGVVVGAVGFWKIHAQNMDRFVVTNVRVFRVNGILNQKMASVPLMRLLDITMDRPFLGLVFHYGHFVFETAAQEQGLKRIGYVPNIENRDLVLQTVIQRAGVRARAGEGMDEYRDFFESLDADPADQSRIARMASRLRHRATDPDDLDGV